MAKKAIILEPVRIPVLGKKYHTSWSKNPYMTWTLLQLLPDGTCILGSKLSRFSTETHTLRVPAQVHSKVKAKQLELSFMNNLQLL
jgi:hypothetical protein